jgi:hypothetical protein
MNEGLVHFLGFDPGHTTGFMRAVYNPGLNALTIVRWDPIILNLQGLENPMAGPPISVFQDLDRQVQNEFAWELDGAVVAVHTAIEDFVGGRGGDVQNTVNKIIGMIMSNVLNARRSDERFSLPKVYRNTSRYPYLPKIKAVVEAKKFKAISHHSVDAGAHLLHRVAYEYPNEFSTMSIS